ncbi:mechanosensitive ion channel family protein [Microbulbifer halophilus]|uniref:Small-conductance mechanosensitive channel n=1 Tax=Microbulbifer halophilus TaxID=453963 RepID=A0ABW5EDS7_9GAMM|nr:mechanosensitive ion channel domain-containing protein [Microbulbifer halophilus]MCW8126373.1 mechanosensitive ion channel [Microbulbifer halophilus]
MTLPARTRIATLQITLVFLIASGWVWAQQDDPSSEQKTAESATEQKADAGEKPTPAIPERIVDPSIGIDELTLRLIPLSKDELATAADAWFSLYKDKTQEMMEAQLKLAGASGETVPAAREALVAIGSEREAVGQSLGTVLRNWERKGGNADKIKEYRAYRSAVVMAQTRTADPGTIWRRIRGWLFSADGGLKLLIKFGIFFGALLGLIAVARIIGSWARHTARRSPHISRLLENFIEAAVFWLLLAVGILLVLSLMGINVTPLFALIGGASFVVAFAMQSTLGNLAAGLMIMFSRPFDEGDFVDIGGVAGTVKAVGMMSTTVITPDNQVIIVPNSNVWGNVITNTTTATRRVDMTFSIGYDDDMETAQRVLEETVQNHPKVLKSPEPMIRVAELAASSVNFIVRPWVMGQDYWDVYWDLTRQVKETFDANGISIPFPQQDVNVRGGESPLPSGNDGEAKTGN